MREYGNGSIQKHGTRGGLVWRGMLRFKEGGKWRTVSKVLTDPDGAPIRAYPDKADGTADNRGRATAEKAVRAWRQSLIDAEAAAEEEAEEAARRAEEEARRVSVAEYVDRYIDARAAVGSIEASTVKDYRTSAKLIRAEFAGTAIQDLTRQMVEAFEVKLLEGAALACDAECAARRPLSGATVGKCHRLLKMVCGHATDLDELIPRNPVNGVKPPKRPRADKNALTAESRARLAEYIEGHEPTPAVCGFALGLFAGLGPAEACGLRWRNVDLDARTIRIDESIGHADGGTYAKAPKVDSRRRTIDIPEQLADVLARRRRLCVDGCVRAGVPLSGDMYVLGDATGAYYAPNRLSKTWTEIASAEGFEGTKAAKVSFYDLRHSYATVAIAAGVDVAAVSAMMGHSSTKMTLDVYGDATPEAKRAAAAAIGQSYARVLPFPALGNGTEGAQK